MRPVLNSERVHQYIKKGTKYNGLFHYKRTPHCNEFSRISFESSRDQAAIKDDRCMTVDRHSLDHNQLKNQIKGQLLSQFQTEIN